MKILGVSTNDFANPLMTPTAITRLMAGVVIFALAVVIGKFVGQANMVMLIIVAAISVAALVVFGMQKRAWILVVFGWSFSGAIYLLPVPFALRDICILLAFTTCVAYRLLTPETTRQRLMLLDVLLLINSGYLIISWMMHPVGVYAFGAQKIGGRPFFNIFLAILGYWVITRLPDNVRSISRIPIYILVGSLIFSGLNLIVYIFPSTAPILFLLMGNLDITAYTNAFSETPIDYNRLKGLAPAGQAIVFVLSGYYAPASLFNPLRKRFYGLLTGFGCILASGFRSMFVACGAAMAIAAVLHRRWREMLVVGCFAALALALIIAGQGHLYELPKGAQRTLTFLPGDWSPEVQRDAQSSSTWRFELWKRVIRLNLINDWWFGDGFGADVEKLIAAWRQDYDSFIILTGGYHNGPLSAIRFVGIFGAVLFYCFMICGSVYSYKAAQLARGTQLFPVAVFVAIQLIWLPIHYTFIFGGYDGGLPDFIFQVAILRVVWRLLPKAREEAGLAPAA